MTRGDGAIDAQEIAMKLIAIGCLMVCACAVDPADRTGAVEQSVICGENCDPAHAQDLLNQTIGYGLAAFPGGSPLLLYSRCESPDLTCYAQFSACTDYGCGHYWSVCTISTCDGHWQS